MKIQPIKQGHVTMCRWCKANNLKTICNWHLTGANKQSCHEHRPQLQAIIDAEAKLAKHEPSEADHQSWLKL